LAAHILIIDGAPRPSQDLLVANGGRRQGVNYALALASQAAASVGEIIPHILATTDGAELPEGMALSDFDGIAWTGAPLNAYTEKPEVRRHVELAHAAFLSGVPCFGSCWGLQVMVVALGGKVHKNPHGLQRGVARAIQLTEAGRNHPMYTGKAPVFDALCIHRDAVAALPEGAAVLAANSQCDVQAMAVQVDGRSFWGVQYHPEFDLHQISAMYKRSAHRLVEGGFARTEDEARAIAEDLRTLHDDPARRDLAWRYGITTDILDADRHRREFANWLRVKVAPRASRRPTGLDRAGGAA
jgi:GMP synthase (glutamine-hydrolysing)